MEHVEPTAQFWYSQSFLVRRKRSFASMSSERQTKYGRSSYRLVREQRMVAKKKEKGERAEFSMKKSVRLCLNLSSAPTECACFAVSITKKHEITG